MVCECENNSYFIFDKQDYDLIKDYYWNFQKNKVYTHINRKTVSLARFLTNTTTPNEKVLLKNKDKTDYRRANLYTGNTYIKEKDYYIGSCFNDEKFLVDQDDYEWIKKYKWHVDKNGYVLTKINNKSFKQHRMILGLDTSDLIEVDHINHNQLDNRKSNLRLVNRSQQNMNKRTGVSNKSGKKGVYKMVGYDNKWCVQIDADGKKYYLGSFGSFEEAAKVREEAAIKLHGKYKCE